MNIAIKPPKELSRYWVRIDKAPPGLSSCCQHPVILKPDDRLILGPNVKKNVLGAHVVNGKGIWHIAICDQCRAPVACTRLYDAGVGPVLLTYIRLRVDELVGKWGEEMYESGKDFGW